MGDWVPAEELVNHNISITSLQQVTQNLDQVDTDTVEHCRTDTFKKKKFLCTILDWNKLDLDIRISKSDTIFCDALLKIGWPNQCSVCRIHNLMGLKFLTRLRVALALYVVFDLKSITHFLLHCHNCSFNSVKHYKWSFG